MNNGAKKCAEIINLEVISFRNWQFSVFAHAHKVAVRRRVFNEFGFFLRFLTS